MTNNARLLLHELMAWRAAQDPDAYVLVDDGGRSLRWSELRARAAALAGSFAGSGLARGDRVAVISPNCVEYLALYLGAAEAGVVLVPVNVRLSPTEWAYIINDAGARALICHAEHAGSVAAIRDSLTTVEVSIGLGDQLSQDWVEMEDWVASVPAVVVPSVATNDPILIMYTSGTTGLPKGVVFTHENVMASLFQMTVAIPGLAGLRTALVAPLFHVAALFSALGTLMTGGSVHLLSGFDPAAIVRTLDEEHIGHISLIPAMIQMLLTLAPGAADRSYDDLKMISYGGAPIAEDLLRQAQAVFRCDFYQAYGQTEAPLVTFLGPRDHRLAGQGVNASLLRSCGRAAPATALRVVDGEGRDVPPGESGEVLVSGAQIMDGYWNQPGPTDKTIIDGWLHTGDAGYLDQDGYLYLQDRIYDMIVSGGENIFPTEIERVLLGYEAVADAAVIGVPDERWGEEVHAVVQLRPGATATEQELTAHCAAELARYKRPRSVEFIDVMPRNASMKLLRRELRAPHWKGRDRRVS